MRGMLIVKTTRTSELGICTNVLRLTDYDYNVTNLFNDTARGWPLHSGDVDFPIPARDEDESDKQEYDNYPRWEGYGLEMRISLIDFVVNELSEMLDYHPVLDPRRLPKDRVV